MWNSKCCGIFLPFWCAEFWAKNFRSYNSCVWQFGKLQVTLLAARVLPMGYRRTISPLIAEKKVLVVGAGGIGCELLKNLVLSGFKHIHVIDLDTIDVSNLNRQFLFRREHVDKPKAEVASNAVKNLLPGVDITYYHDSVFNGNKFSVDFFRQFNLVMNALDNAEARAHVNRMCVASKIPMIESGTVGYLGQIHVIISGVTQCYECEPKPKPKKFPSCTIRNTPSEHIHCTVWAKHCFNLLFGETSEDDQVTPDWEVSREAVDSTGSVPDVTHKKVLTRRLAEDNNYDAKIVFDKLFKTDIEYLLLMEHLWKTRKPPKALSFDLISLNEDGDGTTTMTNDIDDSLNQWTLAACTRAFSESLEVLWKRKQKLGPDAVLTWDKDDKEAMMFVAAVANIRAHIFDIPGKTLFEIKSMAGNIIPAIASTNAIIAGLIVIEAIKVLRGQMDKIRTVALKKNQIGRTDGILSSEKPSKPVKTCVWCSPDQARTYIRLNIAAMKTKTFLEKVLKEKYCVTEPDISGSDSIIYTADPDVATSGREDLTLQELGFKDGEVVFIEDFDTDIKFRVIPLHDDKLSEIDFVVESSNAMPFQEAPEPIDVNNENDVNRKRKSVLPENENDEDVENFAKRARIEELQN